MDGNGRQQAEQLEREIEETRYQLDHTFGELESRLTVDHLKTELRARLNEAAHSLLDTAEQHPVAVLAVAAGAGALLLRRRRAAVLPLANGTDVTAADFLHLLEAYLGSPNRVGATTRDTVRAAGATTRDTVRAASETARDTVRA